jgi:lipoprotein-anchoring transpeptidase ErfK/SrfK
MQRAILFVTIAVLVSGGAASAQQYAPGNPPMVMASAPAPVRGNLGGGFIEFLFGGDNAQPTYERQAPAYIAPPDRQPSYARAAPPANPMPEQANAQMDPRFERQEVAYDGKEAPGTIVIDTPNHFLYLVEEGGKALRYGVGVGRPGFTWAGTHTISAKKEWPDWVPPKEMIARQPYLPHFMQGGPGNPLGARAMYLGSTLYRIHGSNEPWTIGHNVSSGCIRLRNADVIDLYSRVKVGTKVIVL